MPRTAKETEDAAAAAHETFAEDLPKGIHGKMAHIMATMPRMDPEGKNAHFRYAYWSTDQITGYFRKRFGDLGISFGVGVLEYDIREHTTAKEGRSFLTTLLIRFTLTDTETGDQYSDSGIGQGDDPGDKGSNKAMAGATKYWLLKTFLLGGEDAEADEKTDKRGDVVIGESKIEGIKRGGRANKATDAQIRQIRQLARDLGSTIRSMATIIKDQLGDELDLPDEVEEQPAALLRYLESLSAEDAGKLVTFMAELDKDEPEPDTGVSDYP